VLRRILELMREEVVRDCRKWHDEELYNFSSSPNIIRLIKLRRIRWAGHIRHMELVRNVYRSLFRKHEGKGALRRPKHRW